MTDNQAKRVGLLSVRNGVRYHVFWRPTQHAYWRQMGHPNWDDSECGKTTAIARAIFGEDADAMVVDAVKLKMVALNGIACNGELPWAITQLFWNWRML